MHNIRFLEQVGASVAALCATFGKQETEELRAIYAMALDGITPEDVGSATMRALKECEFMPPPAVLRRLAGEPAPLSNQDRASIAWGYVSKAAKSIGGYQSVDFSDKLINATIRGMGGWSSFCQRDEATLETFTRRDFVAIYQAQAAQRQLSEESAAPLLGTHAKDPHPEARRTVTKIECGLPEHPSCKMLSRPEPETKLLAPFTEPDKSTPVAIIKNFMACYPPKPGEARDQDGYAASVLEITGDVPLDVLSDACDVAAIRIYKSELPTPRHLAKVVLDTLLQLRKVE